MASMKQLGRAIKQLKNDKVEKVFLTGDPGVGKTWMARMISDYAIKELEYHFVLWVFLNKEDIDETTINETIARQLSLVPATNESEVEKDTESTKANDKKELEDEKKGLEKKIKEKLTEKKVLFIVDDQVHHQNSENDVDFNELISKVERLLPEIKPKKILITTRGEMNEDDLNVIKVERLSEEESFALLCEKDGTLSDDALTKIFIKKTRPYPADIIVLAKALKHLRERESSQRLEIAKEDILLHDDKTFNAMKLLLQGYKVLPTSVLLDWFRPGNQFLKHGKILHYKELIVYWMLEGYLGFDQKKKEGYRGHSDCITRAYKKGHSVLMELLDCGLLKEVNDGNVMVNGADLTMDPSELCEFIGTIRLGLANVLDGDFGRITETNGTIEVLCVGEEKKKASALLVDANHLSREIPEVWPHSMKDIEVLATFNPTDESLALPLPKMQNCRILVLRGCDFLKSVDISVEVQSQPDLDVSPSNAETLNTNINATPKVETPAPPVSGLQYCLQILTVLEISGPSSLKEIPDVLFKNTPNLQSLNLSLLQISLLPPSFYHLSKLVWLILRGCSSIEELKSLKKLEKLLVLDLSGATSFTRFQDRSFSSNKELQTLNLSQSQIKKLPLLRDLKYLEHLLLSGCTQITRLPKISALTSLHILDLSGATNFKEFHDPSLEELQKLREINISQTAVKKLPLHMSNPRRFYLSGCTLLTRLSFIESMKDLEVLDVSDCSNLNEINENYFKGLASLRVLNISGTQVKTLPSLSDLHNLRELLLARCFSLEKLGELNSLKKLEVLDLSGSMAFQELESSEELNNLKKLDLSGTGITRLPSLSNFRNLCELFLKSCTKFKELPSPSPGVLSKLEELNLSGSSELHEIQDGFFKDMTNLHILDLSETKIGTLPSLSDLKNLYQLSLRNCHSLTNVPDLEQLLELTVLDLSGTAVKKLPEFTESSRLQYLLLKDCLKLDSFSQGDILDLFKDHGKELPWKISRLNELKVLEVPKTNIDSADIQETKNPADVWSISWPAQSPATAQFRMSINGIQFLQLLKGNESLQARISYLPFYVHPDLAETRFSDKFCKYELFLREIYIQTRQIPGTNEKQGCLDIRGFNSYPNGIELVVAHATNVFLIANKFLRCLTDLGADYIKKMKLCWIENCINLETVLPVHKVDDIEGESDIGASIHRGSLHCQSFGNLKCLYLEHCPTLSYICHSSQQLGNLVVLQIKNCQKLTTLFADESADLPRLKKLHLWELQSLRNIVCKMSSLSSLNVGDCPLLQNILPSSCVADDDLEVLEIRSCDELETVFKGRKLKLDKLRRLHLWDLPKLLNIGAEFPQIQPRIRGCPALKHRPAAS